MEKMITEFPNQLREGISIVKHTDFTDIQRDNIKNIVIAGLGGSGIGGDFAKALTRSSSTVPIEVTKGYDIPHYVNKNTLVICNSYSGNTEETLTVYHAAMENDAHIICVSSGGKLLDLARENKQTYVKLPATYASPRACLGFSVIAQMGILQAMGMCDKTWQDDFLKLADNLEQHQKNIQNKAMEIADAMNGKQIVVYTEDSMEPLALRWRQQINENSKSLCLHHVIPEMNHNELVGWRDNLDIAVIFLRSTYNAPRNAVRMDINKKIIKEYATSVMEIQGQGESFIEHLFYLVNIGDWVSYYLAELKGRDVVEVKVIDYLKSELAKID